MIPRMSIAAILFSSVATAGPTPVPSVPPGATIGETPVSEGRWSAEGRPPGPDFSHDESFLTFFVKNRRIEDIKFHILLRCRASDTGQVREVPFTTSSVATAEARPALRVLALDARGHGDDILAFSGSDRWLNGQVKADLNDRRGKVSIELTSAYGSTSPLETCKGYLAQDVVYTGLVQPTVPQPCGYPWSPPDCSHSSPLTGPAVPAPTR